MSDFATIDPSRARLTITPAALRELLRSMATEDYDDFVLDEGQQESSTADPFSPGFCVAPETLARAADMSDADMARAAALMGEHLLAYLLDELPEDVRLYAAMSAVCVLRNPEGADGSVALGEEEDVCPICGAEVTDWEGGDFEFGVDAWQGGTCANGHRIVNVYHFDHTEGYVK